MIAFPNYPLWLIFLFSLVAFVASSEFGHWHGAHATGGDGQNFVTMEAAVFGLLALMIGFTFSLSLARFDERRDGLVAEASAVKVVATRALLLPVPNSSETLALLRRYVQVRLDLEAARRELSADALRAAITQSDVVQDLLLQQAKALAATSNTLVPTGLFIQSLNELFVVQDRRVNAGRHHVPNIVLTVLYGVAVIAFAFAGYSDGRDRHRSRIAVYVMIAAVACVILLIQDLDRPGAGFIVVSQEPWTEVAGRLKDYQGEIPNAAQEAPR